ncbi:MAG: SufE family protein, partial [Gammaproteobacteria bacterium]|nr:SufE family protein [Gammaproteobacteria bacterium]
MDRYQYLIDLGRRLPEFPDELRTEENRIRGCQSQVWFVAEEKDGRLEFRAVSDAAIVSGLIALLLRLYSGRYPQD